MPRAQFVALVARQQAWRDRGKDSDELTVQDEDEDEDGKDDLQEDAVPLKARIRQTTVDMFKRFTLNGGVFHWVLTWATQGCCSP